MKCEVVCYIGLLTCSHANVHVDHRDLRLSLPIILTLLSMIIDNEKAGSKYTHNLDN